MKFAAVGHCLIFSVARVQTLPLTLSVKMGWGRKERNSTFETDMVIMIMIILLKANFYTMNADKMVCHKTVIERWLDSIRNFCHLREQLLRSLVALTV